MFASHLAKEGLAHASIKVYLSAVRNMHITAGLHQEFATQLTPHLELVLKGSKKDKAKSTPPHTRLPITIDIMEKIRRLLGKDPGDRKSTMLWAACCLAFFGFLQCGEFTVPGPTTYDPDVHLCLNDVAIDSRESPSLVRITIKQSKTDPFRKGV